MLGRTLATSAALCILAGLVVGSLVIAAGVPIGWAVAVVGAGLSALPPAGS